jgi:hypothetical protein
MEHGSDESNPKRPAKDVKEFKTIAEALQFMSQGGVVLVGTSQVESWNPNRMKPPSPYMDAPE